MVLSDKATAARFPTGLKSGSASGVTSWHNLPVGGGGASINLAVHSSGVMMTGVDVFGAYIGSTVAGAPWVLTTTPASCPAAYLGGPYLAGGVAGLAIAPSNPRNMALFYCPWPLGATLSTIWMTSNGGANWTLTAYPLSADNSNGDAKFNGQRLAFDPNNSNILYVGNRTSVYATTDFGASFTHITAIPTATAPGGVCGIVFDSNSGTTGGATNRILIGSNGHGIYVTADAGATWSLISGSPTSVGHGYMAGDGTAYFTESGNTGASFHRITSANVVTALPVANGHASALAIDPANPAHAVGVGIFGPIHVLSAAINTGTPTLQPNYTWAVSSSDAPWINNSGALAGGQVEITEVAWDPLVTTSATSLTIGTGTRTLTVGTGLNFAVGDVVRVSNTRIFANYMLGSVASYDAGSGSLVISVGDIDESGAYLGAATGGSGTFSAWTITKERIWLSTGVGVAYLDAPQYANSNRLVDQSFGIESLVAGTVVWPPGGNPLLTAGDRPFWTIPGQPVGATVGQSSYGPNYSNTIVEKGYMAFAISDPTFIVGSTDYIVVGSAGTFAGFDTSGGYPTTAFSATPATNGFPAAWDANHIVMAPIGGGTIQHSSNGGASWANATRGPTSVPQTGAGGGNFWLNVMPLCSDTGTAGVFYCYANGKVYKSANYGASWSVASSLASNNYLVQLQAAPGNAGHLFFTAGLWGGDTNKTSLATVVSSSPE